MQRRLALHLTAGSLGILVAGSGCGIRLRKSDTAATAGATEADVPRIDVDVAFNEVNAGRAVLVDVRSAASYEQRRAKGAMLIELDQIERAVQTAIGRLPADKKPILYCT